MEMIWYPVMCLLLTFFLKYFFFSKRNYFSQKTPSISTFKVLTELLRVKFDYTKMFLNFQKEYGSEMFKMSIGPVTFASISRPDHVKTFCMDRSLQESRALPYKILLQPFGNALLAASGDYWKTSRKRIVQSFTITSPEFLHQILLEESKTLVSNLQNKVGKGEFKAFDIIRATTIESIFRTTLGLKKEINLKQLLECIDYVNEVYAMRIVKPWQYLPFLFNLTPTGRKCNATRNFLNSFFDGLEENSPQRNDFSAENAFRDNIISGMRSSNDTFDDIKNEFTLLVFAGLDTTASTLGYVLLLLGLHPEIQENVYQEVVELDKKLNGKPLEYSDLTELAYLETVIKEAMRLFPPAPIILKVSDKDVDFGDVEVPAGTTITCNISALHRDPDNYFDPLKFNPDNFLPERIAQRKPYSFIPFSHGPRICVGVKYVYMLLKINVSSIIRHLKIKSKSCTIEELTNRVLVQFTARDSEGFPIEVELRSKQS